MMGDSEHPDPTEHEHDETTAATEEATGAEAGSDADASPSRDEDGDDEASATDPSEEDEASKDEGAEDDALAQAEDDDAHDDDDVHDDDTATTTPPAGVSVASEGDDSATTTPPDGDTATTTPPDDDTATSTPPDDDDDAERRDTVVDDPMQYASAAAAAAAELTSDAPAMPPGTPEAPEDPMLAEADLPPPASVPAPMPFSKPKIVPAAAVNEVSPDTGSILGGERVTITGDNLFRESIVRFGGELARTIGATEPHEVRVESPATRRAGKVDVSVQNPGSDVTEVKGAFTYAALPPPKISSVAPNRGSTKGGTELQIVGEGFVPTTKVLLSGHEAEVTFIDATTLDAKTPAGANGTTLDVVVENPDGKKDDAPRAFMFDERYD